MPFHSRETLEAWVEEFRHLGYPIAGSIRVIVQDSQDGGDTGLVGVRLLNSSAEIYIEPTPRGSTTWAVTFEGRGEPVTLTAWEIMSLAGELGMLSALCAFLEAKALSYVGDNHA